MSRSVGKWSPSIGPSPLWILRAQIFPSSFTAPSSSQDRRSPPSAQVLMCSTVQLFFIVLGIVLQCCFAIILLFCLVLKRATLTLVLTLTHLLAISPSTCATVSSSPVSQHIAEPALVNGQTSDDTDAAKPQSKESSPSDSKSSSSEDGNTPKERPSALSDPEAQPWVQVEKRPRNSSGKNKVLPDPSLVMSLRFVVMHYILMIMPTFVFR